MAVPQGALGEMVPVLLPVAPAVAWTKSPL